jgi:hypothetical protein
MKVVLFVAGATFNLTAVGIVAGATSVHGPQAFTIMSWMLLLPVLLCRAAGMPIPIPLFDHGNPASFGLFFVVQFAYYYLLTRLVLVMLPRPSSHK